MDDESVNDLATTGAQVMPLDYTNGDSITTAAITLESAVEHLDVVVNCGGVNTKPRQWDGGETANVVLDKFKIMALGPFLATMSLLPLLKKSELGKVLIVSSDLASITSSYGGRLSYRMAKVALNQQTASLVADFRAQGINVALAAVHPGRVPTRMSGGNESVDLAESTEGMVKIVEDLTVENSGRFLYYTGEQLPW
ncbi:hypothetical protein EDB81DRAFT_889421 [Dactylonectria macrodidyma]|uniref:Uncharacterized protein n=1 Tax=Dactylonectria macrodidyma TaxID=307937 RepID=A0A9P9DWM8_9HYPO|nr:hypothetical protein EDB81DRAFT_889421 [Dactylonectria macrodidyma]